MATKFTGEEDFTNEKTGALKKDNLMRVCSERQGEERYKRETGKRMKEMSSFYLLSYNFIFSKSKKGSIPTLYYMPQISQDALRIQPLGYLAYCR
jgi:hypothetical protein